MTEKRTGQVLADKAGNTPGFAIRPGNGLKVVVRNTESGEQCTIPLEASGREYANCVKKLKQIGWTEALWLEGIEAKRQERIERADLEVTDQLKDLQVGDPEAHPKPPLAGVDKVMHEQLTELLKRLDIMKERVRRLHRDNLDGKSPVGEQSMDLVLMQCAVYEGTMDIAEELRRRGLAARSMR